MMRLFIALPLTKEIEETLGKLIFVLKQKESGGRIKWVAPKNIHLTVKFLGEVDDGRVEDIRKSVARVAAKYARVDTVVDSVGAFPNLVRPRVIWAGLSGGIEFLDGIVSDIEDDMAVLGFPKEEKRFKPHITLGRVKESYGLGNLVDFMKGYQVDPQHLYLDNLVLFKSTLTPRGPIYERLFEARLGV